MDYREASEEARLYKKCEKCGSTNVKTRISPANAKGEQVVTGPTPYLIVECQDCKTEGRPTLIAEIIYH